MASRQVTWECYLEDTGHLHESLSSEVANIVPLLRLPHHLKGMYHEVI